LVQIGLTPKDARKAVAEVLVAGGMEPSRGNMTISEGTLRKWQERVDQDVPDRSDGARHTAIAAIFDGAQKHSIAFEKLPRGKAKEKLLQKLALLVSNLRSQDLRRQLSS
jgi:hypothetical protein